MISERLDRWMEAYLSAWETNEPELIAGLFAEDAVYDPQTGDGELHGRAEIAEWWLGVADEPDNWDFEWLPLVETDDLAVVTGRTRYHDPPTSYRNLFVIRFDGEERCRDFTEWYIEEAGGE